MCFQALGLVLSVASNKHGGTCLESQHTERSKFKVNLSYRPSLRPAWVPETLSGGKKKIPSWVPEPGKQVPTYLLLEIHKSLGLQAQPPYLRACRNCGRGTEGETTGAHTAQQPGSWVSFLSHPPLIDEEIESFRF